MDSDLDFSSLTGFGFVSMVDLHTTDDQTSLVIWSVPDYSFSFYCLSIDRIIIFHFHLITGTGLVPYHLMKLSAISLNYSINRD